MNKELTISTNNFNSDRNKIIEEKIDGGGKTQTIKYGLIKLIGEKEERRVSFETLLAIMKAKDDDAESIMIRELNMVVKISQIVMMKSELETVRFEDNIANLPTASICLDLDFKVSPRLRAWYIRNQQPYYEATVHYRERNGEREYCLEFDKIKRLLKIVFDDDGYDYINKIYEYGILKRGVENA